MENVEVEEWWSEKGENGEDLWNLEMKERRPKPSYDCELTMDLDWFLIADSVHLEMLKNGDAEGCEISELELESRWSVVDLV